MVCQFRYKTLQKCSFKNFVWLVLFLILYAFIHYLIIRDMKTLLNSMATVMSVVGQRREVESRLEENSGLKFILWWGPKLQKYYRLTKCNSNPNCVFTKNKLLFGGNISRFDAIAFPQSYLLGNWTSIPRSNKQFYVFVSHESSYYFPACDIHNDDFFNWTFTYRLDSDLVWAFFVVRNVSRDIVAPSETVRWNTEKYPVHNKISTVLQGRTKAAAWIVSHCKADSLRDEYLTRLQEHLFHYSIQIDVFGSCTKRKCDENDCEGMLRKNYYFYLAFENSFAVDYVTEKVLHGYDNYVVPIVYGGANYSRFLPEGSYINAYELHPYNLAYIINRAMNDAKLYESFFHWTNFYTIEPSSNDMHPACHICKAMNSEMAKHVPAKKEFRFWWNTLNGMKWCLPEEYWRETAKINTDGTHIYKYTHISV